MRRLTISLVLAGLAGMPRAATGQDVTVPQTWLGTWVLDVPRSTYAGAPPYKRAAYRIAAVAAGFRVVYDMVHPRGGTTHLEWTGRMDGRDYPLQGVDQAITYAYTSAGGDSGDIVVKIDGRVAARSYVAVSDDGRTMTPSTLAAAGGPPISTTVYEKR